jgi:hypothetical protein
MIEMSVEAKKAASATNAKSVPKEPVKSANAPSAAAVKSVEPVKSAEPVKSEAGAAASAASAAGAASEAVTKIVEQVNSSGSMNTKIAGFLFVAGALALFGLALNKGMKYAVQQPYWKVIHTEITKNIGISFAMMFLFFVVSIIYYLQDTASGIQNLFVLLLFVFLLSFSAISLGIVTR